MCPSYGAIWCIYSKFYPSSNDLLVVGYYCWSNFFPKYRSPFPSPFWYSFISVEENFDIYPSYGAIWCIFLSKFCPYSCIIFFVIGPLLLLGIVDKWVAGRWMEGEFWGCRMCPWEAKNFFKNMPSDSYRVIWWYDFFK